MLAGLSSQSEFGLVGVFCFATVLRAGDDPGSLLSPPLPPSKPRRPQVSHPPAQGALYLALRFAAGNGLALVMHLLAPGQGQFHLGPAVFKVHF